MLLVKDLGVQRKPGQAVLEFWQFLLMCPKVAKSHGDVC